MPHVFYKTYYHIIWAAKHREKLIDEHINKILRDTIQSKSKELDGKLIEFNSYLDHCHILLTIPPKISISDFVGQLKGLSSHIVNQTINIETIKWQRGFGVLTLSENGLPFVKKYIQNQDKRHKNNELIETLEYVPNE